MKFDGFPGEMKTFLGGLEKHNDRDWFEAHRSDYDAFYLAPAVAFVNAMARPLRQFDTRIVAEPRVNGSIRRIYRDTRFSKDKTPYQPHLHLIFWMGDHPLRAPGFHLVIGAEHAGFGAGHWGFSKSGLARYRVAVADPRSAAVLQAIVDDIESAGAGRLDPPALKKVPAGFTAGGAGGAGVNLLRHKGMVVKTMDLDPKPLFGPGATEYTAGLIDSTLPLVGWLADTVFGED